MKNLKIIIIAVLFFILGSGASVYFVSNVKANKSRNKLLLDREEIKFDLTGLEGVDAFFVSVYGDENISKVWPDYQNKLKTILDGGLNKQGLRIVSDAFDANGVPVIPDFLRLAINAVRDEPSQTIAGSIKLYLNGTFVNHKTKKFVSADRWAKTQAFMVKENEAAGHLEKITRGLMDDFIKDYVKANPKKTDTVSSAAVGQ